MASVCPVCNAPLPEGADACFTCGFKLLGRTQAFSPIAVQPNANTAPASILEECTLSIVKGPQVGNVFRLSSDAITIGRSPQCDIFLNDMTVSRMHATLKRIPGGYEIVDADSFNGLWVNNLNVKEAVLKDGDVVQIGTFCLVYQSMPSM
ncbi:FHA domain-containing protein [uncultured Slackia sp.]|uniref:FHA domain-containing protein n=1 Tax=uncultured Slackia sp. TaxID=665903 RepID=UPI0026DFCB4B|nr:FHA domain-containing protein [uncultured Slackia sp.]